LEKGQAEGELFTRLRLLTTQGQSRVWDSGLLAAFIREYGGKWWQAADFSSEFHCVSNPD
jgi:hypothetical protein